jgi:hypothetical protein
MAAGTATTPATGPSLSFKGKLLALLFGLIVAIVCTEICLRIVWHNSYAGATPSAVYKLRLQNANRDALINRGPIDPQIPKVRFRTDSRSYILPAFQHQQPDATVAFLGGSTTECIAVQEPLRFHAQVSEMLGTKNLKVNTLNAGRSGNTLHDSLNVLLNHTVLDKPDVVVVMHVTNDVGLVDNDPEYRTRMAQPPSWRYVADWISQALSSRIYVVAAVRQVLADAVIRPMDSSAIKYRNDPAEADKRPTDAYEKRLRSFIHMCRDFGIEPVLMTEPLIFSTSAYSLDWANLGAQDRFNALVLKVGEEEHVTVIDLVKYLQDHVPDWNKEMVVFYDGAHVTDNGSTIYAQHISECLEPVIRKLLDDRQAESP